MSGKPLPAAVDVIAPSTMKEGYQFDVESEGRTFLVAVPKGGVKAGDRFQAAVVSEVGGGTFSGTASNPHKIPVGKWRDGLCDCCKFGLFHPLLCCACWCDVCALGQIMQRLGLDWCGKPKTSGSSSSSSSSSGGMSTFKIMLFISVGAFVLNFFTGFGSLALFIYFLIVGINTRSYIRRKYQIPTQTCGACEDCCCLYWCTCCTVAQMGRHVTDFEQYKASCCGETGVAPDTPSIV